uniref:Uncharacterized protein n=1 Tax=Candidatus Kentrum sp. TC TaxID=2126339 RepID=A0A450YMP6_9GAMM|nr:MAG: hypothetical protein BECKTC1821E_GA0114239_102127 [Candidatus Kentron sp. TC]
MNYSKKMPGPVKEKPYLDALEQRISRHPDHLMTPRGFFDFYHSAPHSEFYD